MLNNQTMNLNVPHNQSMAALAISISSYECGTSEYVSTKSKKEERGMKKQMFDTGRSIFPERNEKEVR